MSQVTITVQDGPTITFDGEVSLPFTQQAAASATAAANSAAAAALYDGPWFDDVAALQADTSLTYTAGQAGTVAAGDYVRTRAEGFSYKVSDSGASDHHLTTTGGVKLYVDVSTGNAHALAFGATGDGVTDDTAVFKTIESTSASVIDLGGRSYALTSIWADSANGVLLTKNYRDGELVVDGRTLVVDEEAGRSMSATSEANLPVMSSSRSLGLWKSDDNSYEIWRHLTGPVWVQYGLSRDTSGVPFNWRETWFRQILAYRAARESGVAYTGGWATDTGTTALKSADPSTYISGRAQQSITPGDYVEITFSGGGDLYVVFVGRTSGNYVNVLLDGGQDYLTLPDDGSGNRYFDSYTATDISYKQVVQIASGVPSGSHTVRLTVSSSRNPSSTGDRFIFNALAWVDSDTGPWAPETAAPVWQSGEAVLQNQQRRYGTNTYYAQADGTTGATPPTHTSGSVSDGGVTWVYMSESSYSLTDHRIQAAGSQLEYAYQIQPSGASALEDVGGAMHGNETQTAVQWYLSGAAVTPPTKAWLVGQDIEVKETIQATHSEIGGGSTPVVNTTLRRRFTPTGVEVEHEHTMQTAGTFGWFYAHMWPLLHYSSTGQKYGITEIWSPGDGSRKCSDWYGVSNPFVGRTKDVLMVARGECLQPDGSGGVPTNDAAPYRFAAWLSVSPESVDNYRHAVGTMAGKAMNTSGVDVSSGGYSSMTSKMYFERVSSSVGLAYAANDVIRCRAFYGLNVAGA